MDIGTDVAGETREFLAVVSRSKAPVMILKVPSQEIIAASPGAHDLLDGLADSLIGRNLQDFMQGEPSEAMPLLAAGRITAYESVKTLRGSDERRRLWIQALRGASTVIAVLLKEDAHGRPHVPWLDEDDAVPAIIGSIDSSLRIDRISSEARDMLGLRPDQLVGSSFLARVQPAHMPELLTALGAIARHREGLTLRIGVVDADGSPVKCQLVLLPLEPPPSCAFALLAEGADGAADGRAIADLITALGRGIRGASISYALASSPLRADVDLGSLSARELEIVTRLLAGDRVSSIARLLFLSQSTVRNYLSAVFGKLGVATQQELIELLRVPPLTVAGGERAEVVDMTSAALRAAR